MKKHPMKVGGTGKKPEGKHEHMPKKGKTHTPKGLIGHLKQTEGYVHSTSMPTEKRAGGAKAREKRLMKEAM